MTILSFVFSSYINGGNIIHELTSPDQNYSFIFSQEEQGDGRKRMYYKINFKGKEVIKKSEMGVQIENKLLENALGIPNDTCKNWTDDLQFIDIDTTYINQEWFPLYGQNKKTTDNYKSLKIKFIKGEKKDKTDKKGYNRGRTYFMDIEVRAYDEGIAFRYHFPQSTNGLFLHITQDRTCFNTDAEYAYVERWAQGPTIKLPVQEWEGECERPLTLKLNNGLYASLTEAAVVDYVRSKFIINKNSCIKTSMYGCADVMTPYDTPWRVIMVAEKPIDLINNSSIIENLNEPCRIRGELDWIKPGKAFRCMQLDQKSVLEAIDFAYDRGIQYVHLDAGWYGPEMDLFSDASKVAEDKDLDIKIICEYAEKKGIGIWLYVNQRALARQLDDLLPIYKAWGVKGIKFGFVQIGNQHWTTWLHEAVEKCAEYQIMVDIHDEYRPTGVSRTLPNLLTQEGIRGNECMPDAIQNTTLSFTRFLNGAADYTPCYFRKAKENSYAHQLAMPIIYYSPLTFLFWYDNPQSYNGEQELELWKNIPTTWDESIALDGDIGKYIIMARRKGRKWYVGILNNTKKRKITVKTDFLNKGITYNAIIYQDNDKINSKTRIGIYKKKIKKGDRISIELKNSGGAAIELTPSL